MINAPPNLPPITYPDPERIDPELWELFADTVLIEPFLGVDAYLNKEYGPPVRYLSRITGGSELQRTMQGEEYIETGRIHVLSTVTISSRDRLTLVADGTQPPILQVDRTTDEIGLYFQTVYVGSAVFKQSSSG